MTTRRRKPDAAPAAADVVTLAAGGEQIPREETFEPPEQRAARDAAAAEASARAAVAERTLNARRDRFCREYAACRVGVTAALRAGYGPGYEAASVTAYRLLAEPTIKARIAELTAEITERLSCTAEKLLAEQMAIATADIGDVFDFTGADGVPRLRPVHEIPPEVRRAVRRFKVKCYPNADDPLQTFETVEVELEPKQPALRTLMQHKRMLEPEGTVSVAVTVTEVSRKLPEAAWTEKWRNGGRRQAPPSAPARPPATRPATRRERADD